VCWVVLIQPRVIFKSFCQSRLAPKAPSPAFNVIRQKPTSKTRLDSSSSTFHLPTPVNRETKHVLSASFRSTPGYHSHIHHVVHIIAQRSLGTPYSNGSGLTFWRYLATIHCGICLRRFSSSSDYIASVLRASHILRSPCPSSCNTLFGPCHSARRSPHHQTYFNTHSKVTAQFLSCGYSHHTLNIHYEHQSRTKSRNGSTRFLHMAVSDGRQFTCSRGRRYTRRR
jgi:hypothetical protein